MTSRDDMMSDDRLRLEAARLLAGPDAAKLSPSDRQKALAAILGTSTAAPPRDQVIEWLRRNAVPGIEELLKDAAASTVASALGLYRRRQAGESVRSEIQSLGFDAGIALGFGEAAPPLSRLGESVSLFLDLLAVEATVGPGSELGAKVRAALDATLLQLESLRWCDPLALADLTSARPGLAPPLVSARNALHESGRASATPDSVDPWTREVAGLGSLEIEEKKQLLDRLLASSDRSVIAPLIAVAADEQVRERAMVGLTLRFGQAFGFDGSRWKTWLESQRADGLADAALATGVDPLLLLALSSRSSASPFHAFADALANQCRTAIDLPRPQSLMLRWRSQVSPADARALRGLPPMPSASAPISALPAPEPSATAQAQPPETPPMAVEPTTTTTPTPETVSPVPVPVALRPEPPPPRPPARPSAPVVVEPSPWRNFITENANLLAGIAMLLVGGSLVAYFTWNRHWLFRYTLVPGLFAFFTGGLALVARWLEKSDAKLSGTAAMLRGAAIALLPANCMSVSLLADDPLVTAKWLAVPLMAGLYLVVMSLGVRRWTCAVYAPLGAFLTPALLFLNALVLLRPLARLLAESWGLRPAEVFAFGFYAGFFVAAESLRRFAVHAHDVAVARESRTVWFAAGTLALTYLQVFGWVHAWERQWPALAMYGPLIVLGGGLAFMVERQLRGDVPEGAGTTEESFIGFALILAGVVTSSRDPYLRVVSGALAGVLWLYQAAFRESVLHTYLGLLLLTFAGASINLLPAFSLTWSPVVGYALALLMGAIALESHGRAVSRVELAARELQRALLVITGVVAVLVHSHFRTPPLYTAAELLFVAALLIYRSIQSERRRDGFIGATMAAMAVPYLGFADMQGRDFAGNTLTFGLALLSLGWLGLIRVSGSDALRSVRTAALSLYGVFALAAMMARVLLERSNPPPPSLIGSLPEYLGPLMMLGVLAYTTYLARSMLPFIVGLFIVFALLPGLKADFQILFPWLSWGSGFGSAVSAALALVIALGLKRKAWTDEDREPDRLFDGTLLPLHRPGHALFTTPLLLLAMGLALRVEVYSSMVQLPAGPPLKTVAAVLLCSAIWTFVAVWRRDPSGASLLRLAPLSLLWGFWLLAHRNGESFEWQWPVLWTGLVLQGGEIVVARLVAPAREWTRGFLLEPIERWLGLGGLLCASGLIGAHLFGTAPADLRWLGLFTLAQVARQALRPRQLAGPVFAALALVIAASEASPGLGPLFNRLDYPHSFPRILAFAFAIQLLTAALEWIEGEAARLLALITPLRHATAAVVVAATLLILTLATSPERMGAASLAIAFVTWLLIARWTAPGPSLLFASVAGYLALLHSPLMHAPDVAARQDLLVAPFGLAALALSLAAIVLASNQRAILPAGLARSCWPGPWASSPVTPWLHLPALGLALLALSRHALVGELRLDPRQLVDSFIASTALFLLAAVRGATPLTPLASLSLSLANYHVVQWGAGDLLRARGLSDIHLAALAVAAAVVEGLILRGVLDRLLTARRVTRLLLAGALLVIALLNANFTADPNLADLTNERLIVSASLAFLAGWFFRKLTLATLTDLPEIERDRSVSVAHAVYHLGVAMTLWCLVLLVPAFRSPMLALFGLSLPAAYFQIAAERFRISDPIRAVRYARSAAAVAAAGVLLYAARPVFQIVFFPQSQIRSDYYHYNAALVIALGLVLLRVNAFETQLVAGVLGGIALFTGAYFGVSALRSLSPFDHPFEGAWLAIAAAHAFSWIVLRSGRWREFLKSFARLDAATAEALAGAWHAYFVAAPLCASFAALLRVGPDVYGTCAILGGAASIWLMRGAPSRLATIPVAMLLVMGSVEAVMRPSLLSEVGIIAVAIACARLDPGPFALALSLATYDVALNSQLLAAASDANRFSIALRPAPLVLLGFLMAVAVEVERRLLRATSARLLYWLGIPGALFSLVAALRPRFEGVDPTLAQIGVDYTASATHALLGLWAGTEALLVSATGLLALAHLAAIDRFIGPAMTAEGLGVDHRIALALGLTLLTLWVARGQRRSIDPLRAVIAVALAAVLLGHYASEPGLSHFNSARGLLVSALWFIGAAALRDASTSGGATAAALRVLYQASVGFGFVALALATPLMRTPALSLATLVLPAIYFAVRTEMATGEEKRRQNREATIVAGLMVLPFYLSRVVWSALLDPTIDLPLRHYHTHAIVLIIVGLLLARSHRHGAPFGVALTGAIAMMGGSYFAVTSFEGLSPFEAPMEGAFAGIALLHLWTVATTPHRSTTSLLREFAGFAEATWNQVRTLAGLTALWAAQFLVIHAIADPRRPDVAVAPLLAAGATLFFHHGYQRGMSIYFDLGGIELLAALHTDRLVPSYLDLKSVVWVLLALRALSVFAMFHPPKEPAVVEGLARWRVALAMLILGHVFFHRPWTTEGLLAFALLALTVAFMPRATLAPRGLSERYAALSLIFAPAWLIHFYSAPWAELGFHAPFVTEPLLRTMFTLLLTAAAARTVRAWAGEGAPKRILSIHQVRSLLLAEGASLHDGIVAALSVASGLLVFTHYGVAYSTPEIVTFTALLCGLGYGWYREGRRRASWVACFIGEIHAAAAFGLLRRQMLLTTSFWTYEYDLWLALAASAIFTGLKQRLVRETDALELHRPVTLSLFLIPAVALYWTIVNGLGADMVLVIVGLNSVLFAFLGHDRRNSPYNLVAVSGFVSFVALVFWSKLELRVLHAYVVPVALGVLIISQLFERELKAGVLSNIRLLSLSAMLASTAYAALLDNRYPVTFNLTLLVLCLGSMALGAALRVRLYVTLGLSVLMLDLASLGAKALMGMESQARMTWIGLGVFALGALIVGIGVYHKGRGADLEERLERIKRMLSLDR